MEYAHRRVYQTLNTTPAKPSLHNSKLVLSPHLKEASDNCCRVHKWQQTITTIGQMQPTTAREIKGKKTANNF